MDRNLNSDMNSGFKKVAYLMDHIPEARTDYLVLLLSYWQVFDEINIPKEVVQEILEKATQPETVSRSRRKILEKARYKEFLHMLKESSTSNTQEG
ncbi:hypothetical protein KLEB273_gp110 [Bacillus phage vB_BauM_KLEB27-3]|nr:hypothetical protein KLEB273_gp110 [Bacillus phage vB_BauM_KLEB27-3]